MKIKSEIHTKTIVEIDFDINLDNGTFFLKIKEGGAMHYFHVKIVGTNIEYIYCEPSRGRIIKKYTHLDSESHNYLFQHPSNYTLDNGYIRHIKGYDYEEIEMFNFIMNLDYNKIQVITEEDFNKITKEILTLKLR